MAIYEVSFDLDWGMRGERRIERFLVEASRRPSWKQINKVKDKKLIKFCLNAERRFHTSRIGAH